MTLNPPGNRRYKAILLLPVGLVFVLLFVLPLLRLGLESVRLFVPGHIGADADAPLTLQNYAELLSPAFSIFFLQTLRISLIASVLSVGVALPFAYWISRHLTQRWRELAIGFFISLMFLSILVRTFAIELTLGGGGPFSSLLTAIGVQANTRSYIETLVVAGLFHCIMPMAVLTLLGPIQNVDRRVFEAAQSLGAARWMAHVTVTLPLCTKGIVAAFLFAFTFSISSFVVPMILGKGRVLFISNMVYNRFNEISDYPSGAAISIVLFVITLLIVYGASRVLLSRSRA